MATDLFAGLPVSDLERAVDWYSRLLGSAPSFLPNDVEAVWQVEEHSFVYVELLPERAGGAMATLFVDDLERRVTEISARGLEPAEREEYDNGVAKLTYLDHDGNRLGIGGVVHTPT